jgi:hypothetical protein
MILHDPFEIGAGRFACDGSVDPGNFLGILDFQSANLHVLHRGSLSV